MATLVLRGPRGGARGGHALRQQLLGWTTGIRIRSLTRHLPLPALPVSSEPPPPGGLPAPAKELPADRPSNSHSLRGRRGPRRRLSSHPPAARAPGSAANALRPRPRSQPWRPEAAPRLQAEDPPRPPSLPDAALRGPLRPVRAVNGTPAPSAISAGSVCRRRTRVGRAGKMAMTLLEDWCRGMDVNAQRALLVWGIPVNCDEAEIEETLQAAMPQVPYRVLGRMFWREENAKAALLELTGAADYAAIPREMPGKGGVWKVVYKPPTSDAEFLERLHLFLAREGWTVPDVARVLGFQAPAPAPGPDMPAEMLSYILDNVIQPLVESIWYKKLTVFSGKDVPGPGEETFDPWLEHTHEVLSEWQVSDTEKRRRLMESLRGPAADVIRILKTNNPAITTLECLKALEQVFGSVESSRDAQVRFLNTYQNPGEKLSAYVIRLEPLLQKVVEKGAIEKDNVNQARLEQVIAGANHSGAIRRQLWLTGAAEGPAPNLFQLLVQIREEEAKEEEEEAEAALLQLGLDGSF